MLSAERFYSERLTVGCLRIVKCGYFRRLLGALVGQASGVYVRMQRACQTMTGYMGL